MEEYIKIPDQEVGPDELLETEGGMFQMEITGAVGGAYELIDASTVDEVIKSKCREILEELENNTKTDRDKVGPYDLCRRALFSLTHVLNEKDAEQNELFESLKGVILKARDSALNWKKSVI